MSQAFTLPQCRDHYVCHPERSEGPLRLAFDHAASSKSKKTWEGLSAATILKSSAINDRGYNFQGAVAAAT
jgi:hypothetical protein